MSVQKNSTEAKKPSPVPTQASPVESTNVPQSAPKPMGAVAKAQIASATVAKKQAETGRGPTTYANERFAEPPQGAHQSKHVPISAVQAIQKVFAANGPGIYLVSDERGHTSIIAVGGPEPGKIATHGGCVQAKRAAMYGLQHAGIYKLPVVTVLANKDVKDEVASRQPAKTQ